MIRATAPMLVRATTVWRWEMWMAMGTMGTSMVQLPSTTMAAGFTVRVLGTGIPMPWPITILLWKGWSIFRRMKTMCMGFRCAKQAAGKFFGGWTVPTTLDGAGRPMWIPATRARRLLVLVWVIIISRVLC